MRGGQWQALYLAEGLVAAGHQCRLLAPASSPLLSAAQARGLPSEPLSLRALWRWARQADVLHAHDARAHSLAALTAHPCLVVARRVAFPLRNNAFSRWKRRRARHFIAVSEHVRGVLIAGGVHPERISVVYDGVPLLPLSLRNGPIVAPASADPMKAAALLSAAERIGGFRVRCSANLADELRQACLLVYLSWQEGLGSGVLLAMSAGVPVVASQVGGLPEIVRDEQTGLLVANCPEAVARAVIRLCRDEELAARLAQAARQQIERGFTIEALVRRTLRVYEQVR